MSSLFCSLGSSANGYFFWLSSSLCFSNQCPINWIFVHSPSFLAVALPVFSGTLFLFKPFPLLLCTRKYYRATCSTRVAGLQWVIDRKIDILQDCRKSIAHTNRAALLFVVCVSTCTVRNTLRLLVDLIPILDT